MVVHSFAMGRMLLAAAAMCALVLVSTAAVRPGIPAKSELLIELMGDQQVVGKPFEIRIKNNGDRRLTICLTACGRAIVSADDHSLPAFAVQTRVRKKWSKEILGCDPGATRLRASCIAVRCRYSMPKFCSRDGTGSTFPIRTLAWRRSALIAKR